MPKYKDSPEVRAAKKERKEKLREFLSLLDVEDMSDLRSVFKEMVGEVLENGLEAELDDELGYSRYDYRNKETENSRNGHSRKTMKTSAGEVEIAVPRDRNGEFEPRLVKKNETTLSGDIEEKIISMYAMKRQGKRSDLTSAQVAQKLTRKTSRQILAEQEGQSQDQIRRYIRLTSLVPELLEFVDLEKIKLCPAVELSYLDEEAQRDVVDQIDETAAFPSHAQTIRMRKAFEQGKLNYDLVKAIMNEEKPNQKPKYSFSYERLSTYIPKELHSNQVEEFVVEALKYYTSRRRKGKQSAAAGKRCDVAS